MRNRAIMMLGLAVVFAIVAAFLAQTWLRTQVATNARHSPSNSLMPQVPL